MLNDSLIIKHFKDQWKQMVIVERSGSDLLITDRSVIVRLPDIHKLFNDRAMFPELPTDGECFNYSKQRPINKQGLGIQRLIDQIVKGGLRVLAPTDWQFCGKTNARLFYSDNVPIFIDQKFLDLFNDSFALRGNKANSPIIMGSDDYVIGAIMPVSIRLQPENIFPAHLKFDITEETGGKR